MGGNLITGRPPGLVDVLDRILDKGLVIAGDIKVSLANVELLTLQIRLIICSIDKAEQIGLNWWRYDRNLTAAAPADPQLAERLGELERAVERLSLPSRKQPAASPGRTRPGSPKRNPMP